MAVRRRPVNDTVETDNEAPETEPTQERSSSRSIRSKAVSSGWGSGGGSQEKRDTVKAPYLDISKGAKLIKFMDEIPPVRFERHWVPGQGYSNCPKSLGTEDTCPLCAADHRPGQAFLMNVIDLTDGPNNAGDFEVKTYTFGVEVRNQLLSFLEDERKFPALNDEKCYWEIRQVTDSATKRKSTKILPVKARDLPDDFDLEPLTFDELEAIETRYGVESIFSPYLSKLEDIARNL